MGMSETIVTIVPRRLTAEEALCLHRELKTTPNILGYTAGELRAQRDVYVAECEGRMVGACFNTDLPFGWTEIAVLYVLPDGRGQGAGRALFDAAWERIVSRGRHIFVLSRNPIVIGWMEEKGMQVTRAGKRMPIGFHLYSMVYMAHPYRNWEVWRKLPQMLRCPPMMEGIWENPTKANKR